MQCIQQANQSDYNRYTRKFHNKQQVDIWQIWYTHYYNFITFTFEKLHDLKRPREIPIQNNKIWWHEIKTQPSLHAGLSTEARVVYTVPINCYGWNNDNIIEFFLNYFTYIYMWFQFVTVKSSFSVISPRLLHCKWYESTRILRGNIHFILYTSKRKTTHFKKIRGNFNWFLCLKMLKSTNASSSHSLHSISGFITDDNTNERTIFWS